MFRCPSWLLAAVALAVGTACSPGLNWREWRTPEAGLTQLFPCKPMRQQRTVQLGDRPFRLILQVCDVGEVTWAVAHADVADPGAVGAALRMLVASAHANIGAVRGVALPAAVTGATPQAAAGRFRFQGKSLDGRHLEEALVVFARGTVVFQVTALGPTLSDDDIETFFGSLRAGS